MTEDQLPICGETFCEDCEDRGDCLACYSQDPCSGGGSHTGPAPEAKKEIRRKLGVMFSILVKRVRNNS